MARKTKQAYKQAPWRRQLQSVGFSLGLVVSILAVLSIYLIISAQAASAGLQIMDMHYEEEEILRVIANERTELAWNTSYTQMQKRAEKTGFQVATAENVQYMVIPGYQGQNPVLLAPPPGTENTLGPVVNEYYQQSLWDWFYGTFLTTSNNTSEAAQ
jgi:hypothetical protein